MKIKFYSLSFLIFIISSISLAQSYGTMYPEAPEIWSKPEPIKEISEDDSIGRADAPTIIADGKTLYFGGWGGVTHLTDTGWTKPVRVPYLFDNLSEDPVVSPDGKRIFFTWWKNGWQMFYADWDSAANDWGPVKDAGPAVDNPHYGWGYNWGCRENAGCFLDDTTLIYTICGETFITHWHSVTTTWDTAVSWPYIYPSSSWDGLRFGTGGYGIAVTTDRNKVYLGGDNGFDTTTVPWNVDNFNLVVYYRDTTDTTDLLGYGKPYLLNISFISDSLYSAGVYKGVFEGFPTITADGKTLFFEANYDSNFTIYVSHLLVDANGDTITSVIDKQLPYIPNEFRLFPAYPNPFNPSTTITFSIPVESNIKLSIYDILGRKIRTLEKGIESRGEHKITFDGSELASGTYIILLETPQGMLSRKILLIK